MPSINDLNTVKAIAREYIANERNKEQALLTVGYKPSYARSKGMKLYANPRLTKEIARLDAKSAEKSEFKLEDMRQQYQEDRLFAIKCNSASAAVSASTGLARTYGWDKDNDLGAETRKELDDTKQAEANRIANIRLREGIA